MRSSLSRFRIPSLLLAVVAALLVTTYTPAQTPAKRPLKHTDYDSWKSIQSPVLSRDGKYLAYNLMPAEGDGEFVVRGLASGIEHRVPRGRGTVGGSETASPAIPARFGRGSRGAGDSAARGTHQFTPDVKAVVFLLAPTRAELDKARQAKKKPEEMPRTVLAIMDLTSGKITARIDRASSFSVGGDGAGLLIYKRGANPDDRPATPPAGSTPSTRTPPRTYGTDLVVRNLADGSERVLNDVVEYSLTRDGKLLVYTVSSKKEESNGVYVVSPPMSGAPVAILAGKGRYSKLTWDEKQTQLVFLSDRDDSAAAQPKFKVYHWDRGKLALVADPKAVRLPPMATAPLTTAAAVAAQAGTVQAPATDLLGPTPPGLPAGWVISDRGSLSFSPDGTRLYLATGPAPNPSTAPATPATPPTRPGRGSGTSAPPSDDKVVLDLWHWKDEYIQPMQKVRSAAEQNRTYRAVYHLKDKLFRQLSDENIDVTPAAEGDWAVGADNRKYRILTGYGPTLSDYLLINTRTGEKKPAVEASLWSATLSPRGRYLLSFDGKDWHALAVPSGKKTNLTAKLSVKFVVEDWDMPGAAPAYGYSGWTADEKYVLLHDRYDVWKVAPDGSEAKLLTGGLGRKTRTVLRPVRLSADDTEQRERGFDLSKPLLLKADNESTRDEGFFRLEPGADVPKMLIMGARSYGTPLKAKDADTLLLTVSTFYDYPDYFVTGPDFRELRRVTDANPQKKDFVWGKAELIRYKNLDGVELSGVLIKPEDFDPHKKYPLLVYIYERLSQNLHNFVTPAPGTSINASYYVSNGYLVLMPDIVYKVGSPGQSALKCVLPAIQAVVDRGCVNEQAIGIQGHSWGGYQIAYMVTQTNRFKAAAAGAPVANMVSAYDGIRWGSGLPRQFQYELSQSRIGGSLWQYPMRYLENSPIFMADRVQTPLLMLHNDQDDAVPWYQGIEYFLALRRLGKECYLLNYNGEPHGLRKKSSQRDYTMRMQQFFDHHLKGAAKPAWMEKGIPYAERDKEKEQWKGVLSGESGK